MTPHETIERDDEVISTAPKCPRCHDDLDADFAGRHCIKCGWDKPTDEPKKVSYDQETQDVAWQNKQALVELMKRHGLFIAAADFPNWRPTVPSSGSIPGVAQNVTIIATNGLLGYFVNDENSSVPVLCGHIQCFTGEVKTLFSTQKQKRVEEDENKTRKRRVKKSQMDLAMELLKSLQEK